MKQRAGGGRVGRWCDCSTQAAVLPEVGGGWEGWWGRVGGSKGVTSVDVVVVVDLIGLGSVILQQLVEQQAAGD